MKWEIKEKIIPEVGDRRVVRKFAWLPVIAINTCDEKLYRIWLQSYDQIQQYVWNYKYNAFSDSDVKWYRWVKIDNWF